MPLSSESINPRLNLSPETWPKPTTCIASVFFPVTWNFFVSISILAASARLRPSLSFQKSRSVAKEMAVSNAWHSSRTYFSLFLDNSTAQVVANFFKSGIRPDFSAFSISISSLLAAEVVVNGSQTAKLTSFPNRRRDLFQSIDVSDSSSGKIIICSLPDLSFRKVETSSVTRSIRA